MRDVQGDVAKADEFARKVVRDAGLEFLVGERPKAEQIEVATMHGRQDAAMAIALLTMLLERQRSIKRWTVAATLFAGLAMLTTCAHASP